MASRSKPAAKAELVAIYRLEFYRKQRNWKFCKDLRKDAKNKPKSEVLTEAPKSATTKPNFNETYSIDAPVHDNAISALNDAFLENSDKSPPTTPPDPSTANSWPDPPKAKPNQTWHVPRKASQMESHHEVDGAWPMKEVSPVPEVWTNKDSACPQMDMQWPDIEKPVEAAWSDLEEASLVDNGAWPDIEACPTMDRAWPDLEACPTVEGAWPGLEACSDLEGAWPDLEACPAVEGAWPELAGGWDKWNANAPGDGLWARAEQAWQSEEQEAAAARWAEGAALWECDRGWPSKHRSQRAECESTWRAVPLLGAADALLRHADSCDQEEWWCDSLPEESSFLRGAARAPHSSEHDLTASDELPPSAMSASRAQLLSHIARQTRVLRDLHHLLGEAGLGAAQHQRPLTSLSLDHYNSYNSCDDYPTRDVGPTIGPPRPPPRLNVTHTPNPWPCREANVGSKDPPFGHFGDPPFGDPFIAGSFKNVGVVGRGRGRLRKEKGVIGIGMGRPYRL